MQNFRLLASFQASQEERDEGGGSQDLLGAKGIRSLYGVTQQPEFGNTNYMKGVKTQNELWRVAGGDLHSLIDMPLRPRAALQLSRVDLATALPLQPGKTSLQAADRGEPIPALHAADEHTDFSKADAHQSQPLVPASNAPAELVAAQAHTDNARASRKQIKRRRVQAAA